MKVVFKNKEFNINEINFKQRLELIGFRTGVIDTEGKYIQGEGLGKYFVKVFELSGLQDSDFKGLDEVGHIEFISLIVKTWTADEKK